MKKLFIICSCLLLMFKLAPAQNKVDLQNKIFVNNIDPMSREGWIEFRKNAPYHAETVFTEQPELLNLQPADEMRLLKTNSDVAGNKHFKFAQFYNGVRVEGIEQTTHERNGKLHLANGNFVAGLELDVSPSVSPEQSIATALAMYPAEKYSWQDEQAQADFKRKKNDDQASIYPKPELLIVKIDPKAPATEDNYTLAYRMYVFAEKPYISEIVYVDAHTGDILRSKKADITCNDTDIETTFNGTQTISTDFRTEDCLGLGDELAYFSIDDCHPDTEIKSYYTAPYGSFSYGDDWLICDEDNDWPDLGSTKMVLTTLWGAKQAYWYYRNVHGHESFDGSDGLIDVFNGKTYMIDDDGDGDEDDPSCRNANWQPVLDNLHFGAGNDCDPGTGDDYNTLDIIGHEYMHGIIYYAHFDALDYAGESGALNESFADIFGEMVEYYTEGGDTLSWEMGEDRGALRSYRDPKSKGDPDTYLGINWADTEGDDDDGGVHTNSSVQNHMFYLLSQGGSGTNDHGVDYYVEGIGYDHAQDIAWQAAMEYLNSDDGYITARNAWIQSAIDLFGSCSQEVISVGQAWQAAGVTEYTAFDLASVCGTYTLSGYADATYGIENSTLFFGGYIGDCTTTINSPAIVTFESGFYVQLNPGFEAKSGCTFVAIIDECEVSDYDSGDLKTMPISQSQSGNASSVSGIKIYPSPADANITVELNLAEASVTDIVVYDLSGRMMAEWMVNEMQEAGDQKLQYSTAELTNGVYICIMHLNNEVRMEKFIVQH